jgi:hypothetical protein
MKQLLFILLSFLITLPTFAQTPLAIFTGVNEGGPDGVAIALAEDLPAGTRIYLTTEEYQAGSLTFGDNTTGTVDEFVGYWEAPTYVPEGMVLAISEFAPNNFSVECNNTGWFTFGVDCGSFTHVSGDFDINQEQEFYLYSDNDSDPGNGITQMHAAMYVNFAGNKAFPAANNPGTPTGDWPYAFEVDSLPNVANPTKRFLNFSNSGRFTNHIKVFLEKPSRWNSNDAFLNFTKLDTARLLQLNLEPCLFSADTDGDFICDFDPQGAGIYTPDNCINTPNSDQADADNDGIGDVCDDSDGDGVVDAYDNCPAIPNPGQEDSNNNGIGDACDITDSDGDGIDDPLDNCPFTANTDQADNDGDNIGDVCDDDDDNDGILDINDNCPLNVNVGQADNDGDTIGDVCDDDDDNDGVLDANDNCPLTANTGQGDNDSDGLGDACDDDDDNDGVLDVNDNCPLTANPGQGDNDSDGLGDACDDDDDNDGVLDVNDNCPLTANAGQEDIDVDNIGDECDTSLDASVVIQNAVAAIQGSNANKGQKKSLANRLKNANKDYCKNGDIAEATAKLNAFISKVQGPPNTGKFTSAAEQLLIASAQAMIDAMNDGTYDCSGSSPRLSVDASQLDMTLYPNPSQGKLSIEFNLPTNEKGELTIIDLAGRTQYRKQVSGSTEVLKLNFTPNFTNGQYFVKLTSASGTVVKKVILNR